MGLFQNLFKPQAAKPQPAPVAPVPAQLPKITAPTAAQIAQSAQPSPAAQQLLTPQQTPSQYLSALQEKQMGEDMVKTMAHGMPDREGVHWATQSVQKVSDKLPPEDVQAMQAAQTWVKNPTDANQAAAAAAAANTNYQGPGAWAAQAAAWAQPATPTAAPAGAAAAPRLAPNAVAGAVLMSAAIAARPELAAPKVQMPTMQAPTLAAPTLAAPEVAAPQAIPIVPPQVQTQTFREQHPFIALGMDVASGKNTWA